MAIPIKSEEADGRSSFAYQDESDDVQSLLSDGARTPDPSTLRENPELRRKTLWVRVLAALGVTRATDHLPYYELQRRPKQRSRRCLGSCLRYFIAYAPLTPLFSDKSLPPPLAFSVAYSS